VVSGILDQVVRDMDGMDAETRVILAFRYHQGMEFGEIASRLGTDEQRVTGLHNAGVLEIHKVMLRAVTLCLSTWS
jgi:DNA-directed RNA polymerase specialized sigma subunit